MYCFPRAWRDFECIAHVMFPFLKAGEIFFCRQEYSGAITMIGDMIGELTGKIVGQRVVRHHHGQLKLERTMESKGKILGVDVTFLATVKMRERPQGGMVAEGNGVMMTMTGEKVILHGSGISIPGKGPAMSMRGARYAQTTVPALSRLNNVAIVFELDSLPDGTIREKMWEWK
jgi:hypothetical protein